MTFEPSKLLQNVELKLRGRTALLVSALAVLAVLFWLVLRDYAIHPLLSQVVCYAILGSVFLVIIVAQFGKARPEEVPEKSILQLGPIGLFFARGLSSQREMMQLIRECSGIEKLPPPSSRVQGSPTDEKNYQDLPLTEANNFVAEVERSVQNLFAVEAQKLLAQLQKELPAEPGQLRIEGRAEPPKG